MVEQSRLGIQCLSLACYDCLHGIYPEFWEPDDAVARWVPPDSVVADPPSFRPPPPLFIRPSSPSSPCPSPSHTSWSLFLLPSPPCPSPSAELDVAAVAAFSFLQPWPLFETLWLPAVHPPLPYADVDLCNAVFSFYLDSLDSDEQVDGLDFMD